MPRYRLTITKEFDDSLWGIEEFLAEAGYEDRAEGLAAFIEIMQEDVHEAISGSHWELKEVTDNAAD